MMTQDFIRDRAGRLSTLGTIRVTKWRGGKWFVFACNEPIIECDTESEAWSALAAMCLLRSREVKANG